MAGQPHSWQIFKIDETSSVLFAKTTASGGWFAIHVVVWACCSLTDVDVERNSPNNCFKVLIAWFIFCCSNKVIALKKMFGQMIQKPTPKGGDQYITEFKKRKSAQKTCKLTTKPKAV